MSKILVVGNYAPTDVAAFRDEFGVTPLASLTQLAEAARDDCVALAFKGGEPLGGAAMDLLPNLRLIANFGVGYDAISIADADARGIKVTNTPDVLNDDVADLAVAMLISRQREMAPAERWLRDGNWPAEGAYPLARKMSGRKVGILGMGRIGREIADRLAAFKCQIHYQSRSRKETPAGWTYHADPVALAAAVDDLVVSVVGGAETLGFVSAEVIAALGADGVIVNISRGSVIDEEALIAALQNGQIRGAALDVFRNEPKIDPRFLTLPNVLLLPHIGSATVETRARMGALQRQNLAALLAGQPLLTPVN
ncbi:2-hydroxyacid dehydrogenase [Paracoccus sulfuroxidans]|uniref:Lactate dehydrogenase-like 2-hydroxyacid dehydrogenase n=1 Tax=Paracoccus sulfuroxidans TaxID=384678 RepID=A0A562NM63_9RHOB|nr:2-hydroxyacid dehydrogenase [Paracoccus sulfuroxidans]TWI33284.1 lactate dehydrogenase-like 2-hydroxyacid dehydrogenase [Paracoccus sulfuroxidans]